MRAQVLAELLRDGKMSALEIVERLAKDARNQKTLQKQAAYSYPPDSLLRKAHLMAANRALERENAFELVISIFKASRMV